MADDPLKEIEGKPLRFEVQQEQASLRELPVDEETREAIGPQLHEMGNRDTRFQTST